MAVTEAAAALIENGSKCRLMVSRGHCIAIQTGFWQNGLYLPPVFLLCGWFLHFFLSQHCFCSSSLHLGQVSTLCWCGRPGKWKVSASCQAKESTSSSQIFFFCLQTWTEKKKEKRKGWIGRLKQWQRMLGLRNGQWWLVNNSHPDTQGPSALPHVDVLVFFNQWLIYSYYFIAPSWFCVTKTWNHSQ